jgi:hypothetical protein
MRPLLLSLVLGPLALLAGAPPALAAWTWPLAGEVITPYRNGDDPYAGGQHRGVDIAGTIGAPVVAAAAGEVLFAGAAGSSGVTVSIRTAEGLDTSYLHMSSVAVRKGERVSTGARIGAVGTTGRRSVERPHLHFGVRTSGTRHDYRDPLAFLPPPLSSPRDPLPAPVPVDAPVRVVPEPVPVPVPLRRPAVSPEPRRVPIRRRIPAGRRVPAVRGVPVHGGAPAAVPAPAGSRSGAPLSVSEARSGPGIRPAAEARPAAARQPALGPRREADAAGRAARPEPVAAGPRQAAGHAPRADAASEPPGSSFVTRPQASSGPDVGWALACLGLLLAAGILGLTSDGRDTARRGAGKLSALLRPPGVVRRRFGGTR